jgi:hypothetical protein
MGPAINQITDEHSHAIMMSPSAGSLAVAKQL